MMNVVLLRWTRWLIIHEYKVSLANVNLISSYIKKGEKNCDEKEKREREGMMRRRRRGNV
jgi:hypothetical protein